MVLEGTLCSRWGCDSAPCPQTKRALGCAEVLIWVSESCRAAPFQVPWSRCTLNLVLQMSSNTGWDYYLCSASRNSVCQDLCAVFKTPHFCTTDSQELCPESSPVNLHDIRSEKGLPESDSQCWGRLVVPPGFSFLTCRTRTQGRLL